MLQLPTNKRDVARTSNLVLRHSADLLQQPQKIGLAPFFDDSAVRKTIEDHRLHLDLFPVDGTPKNTSRHVPRIVKPAATLSPSAINSSSVH
jgi:hypothetical protein